MLQKEHVKPLMLLVCPSMLYHQFLSVRLSLPFLFPVCLTNPNPFLFQCLLPCYIVPFDPELLDFGWIVICRHVRRWSEYLPPGICGRQPGQLHQDAQWEEVKVGQRKPEVSFPAGGTVCAGTHYWGTFYLQSLPKNWGEVPKPGVCVCVFKWKRKLNSLEWIEIHSLENFHSSSLRHTH